MNNVVTVDGIRCYAPELALGSEDATLPWSLGLGE